MNSQIEPLLAYDTTDQLNHEISRAITDSYGLADSVCSIDTYQRHVTISTNPLEFRQGAASNSSKQTKSTTLQKSDEIPTEYQLSSKAFDQKLSDHERIRNVPIPTGHGLENTTMSQGLDSPQPGPIRSSDDSELHMQMDEQNIIDTMSKLERMHKQILERKLVQQTREKRTQDAIQKKLNHIKSVETQIKTMDVMRSNLINDRTRDAAEHILFDATKV